MRHGFIFRILSYSLCVLFFLQIGGFSEVLAAEKGKNRPVGEMVCWGEAMIEVKERTWKKVEIPYFPIFQGAKIKTEKGSAIISLRNENQIEMSPNTTLLIDRKDQIRIFQGRINFRLGSPESISIRMGNLTLTKTHPPQVVSAGIMISPKNDDAIGTISVSPNGSVTIQNNQGQMIVLNQEQVTLAALSPKESLKIPSKIVESPSPEKTQEIKLAQVGELPSAGEETARYFGLPWWGWGAIGLGVLAAAGAGIAVAAGGGGGGGGSTPVCR
jgi:hypothetical protein